eukprot:gene33674-40738_t
MFKLLRFPRNRSLLYGCSRGLSETVLSFKNVTFEYSPLKPILSNATFNVEEGRKVTIMGQNGSGKSTLLKLINGKLNPQK